MSIARLMQMAAAGVPSGGGDVWTDPDLANASYDSVSFSVAGQDGTPLEIAFNNDGTKFYIVGLDTDTIYQYSLSTAFDLSTASYDSVSFSVTSQESNPTGVYFKPDGTKMYIVGTVSDNVHQYSLSTAFDLSTASYDSISFGLSGQDAFPYKIFIKSDGLKMYLLGLATDTVYQYTLSSSFDVSSASYDSVSFSVSSQESAPRSLAFNPDGTKMYIVGSTNDTVYQYSLSTAFDLSTASYDSVSFGVSSQDSNPFGMKFNNTGSKLYIVGATNDTIYQYST